MMVMEILKQFDARATAASKKDASRWLCDSDLLDQEHPRVRILAKKLAIRYRSEVEQAVACFEHVRSLRFAFAVNNRAVCASQVARFGAGDAMSKATLLVSMLHSLEIPARFHFVDLPPSVLRGLFAANASPVLHCFVEVFLANQWFGVDTYIHDPALAVAARIRLLKENRTTGYGLHMSGQTHWDGRSSAFGSFSDSDRASEPIEDWGVFSDPEDIVERHPSYGEGGGGTVTLRRWVSVALANYRVTTLRASRRH